MTGIVFHDHPPSRELTPWIASFWSFSIAGEADARSYTVLPDGCSHLSFCGGEAWLGGPRTRAVQRTVEPGRRAFGVRFRPGAARPFLGLGAAPTLRDTAIPAPGLETLAWASELAACIAQLGETAEVPTTLDRALLSRADRAVPPDPLVTRAVAAIATADPAPTVTALAGAAGVSTRHFRRRFLAAVDLSPKELLGIWRVRHCALAILERAPHNWSDFSAQHDFADQSHLVREVRRLSGLTPRELARRLARVEHPHLWRP